jgi:capsular exopolysaccharide synthesis family protein
MNEKTIILPAEPPGKGGGAGYCLTFMTPKRRYWSYLKERWWVVLICLALAVGGVLTYEALCPERFSSYAQLYVAGEVQVSEGAGVSEDQQNYFGTQIELLKSARLQNAALDRANLTMKPKAQTDYTIEVIQPMRTSILQVQAGGPDPATTRAFLQGLIEAYLAFKKETRRTASEDMADSLTRELTDRDADLKKGLQRWADFQRSNNVGVLEEEAKSAGMFLADMRLQLEKLRLEQKWFETGSSLPKELAARDSSPAVAPPSSGTNWTPGTNASPFTEDSVLRNARLDLAMLRADWAAKTNDLSPMHPAMRHLKDSMSRLERTVAILEEQDAAQSIERKREELKTLGKRVSVIQAAIPDCEANVLRLNDLLSQGQQLKSDLQRQQASYDRLTQVLQTVDLGKNIQAERLSVLQEATPGRPEDRLLSLRTGLAALGGLALGLGIVFLWYLLDDRFVSFQDIKDQFGEPLLGLVPQIKSSPSNPRQALLQDNDPRLPYAESYRHLRSALLLSSFNKGICQTLLFTSASAGEGKTTVATNLARSLARSGLRVALFDLDFHTRGVQRMVGAAASPGVLDFLRGQAVVSDILQRADIPGLDVVFAGTRANRADGLFLHARLADLIAEIRKDRDFIILDAPPILSADDAALLVPHSDSVVLVVRPFYTHSRLVRQTLDMLYQRQAKSVAIIYNRARKDDFAGRYLARNGLVSANGNGTAALPDA